MSFRARLTLRGVRDYEKTEVLYCSTSECLEQPRSSWQVHVVQAKATTCLASVGTLTLGVAIGSPEAVAQQLDQKTKVVKAMHERVRLCQNPQTEFVLANIGRANHIICVHGHGLADQHGSAAKFDDVGRISLERLFPCVTTESHIQASLNDKAGGLGWRKVVDIARPRHCSCRP